MTRATCEVCAWVHATDAETDRYELNRAMIDHHVETGHTTVATSAECESDGCEKPEALETDGSSNEREVIGESETASTPDPTETPNANASSAALVDGWTPIEAPNTDRGPWRGTDGEWP